VRKCRESSHCFQNGAKSLLPIEQRAPGHGESRWGGLLGSTFLLSRFIESGLSQPWPASPGPLPDSTNTAMPVSCHKLLPQYRPIEQPLGACCKLNPANACPSGSRFHQWFGAQPRCTEGFPQALASDALNRLSRLWVVAISAHSLLTCSRPRNWNRSSRLDPLIWPNTGSTTVLRRA
jgi:hypothetical protein